MSQSPPTEGKIPFKVGPETFETSYRLYGSLSSSQRPLVVLHGGPGIPSDYLEPFTDLTTAHSIPVILYDQIGCGKSTHLPHKPPSFWTENLFMDELDNLLNHLGIAGNFDLAGHSWGGMLASRFAGSRQPPGLKNLILANSLARMEDWMKSNAQLLTELPEDVQMAIRANEENGTLQAKGYQDALPKFMAAFVCQVNPFPEGVEKSLVSLNADRTVATAMYGPAWLVSSGSLKDWTVVEDLPKIKARTLVYHGEFDQAREFVVAPFLEHIPNVRGKKFLGSSHMSHYEVRDEVMGLIVDFLRNE